MNPTNHRHHQPSRKRHGARSGNRPLTVLFEDDTVIAVCKPDGVLTQGDITGDRSLFDMVRDHLASPAAPAGTPAGEKAPVRAGEKAASHASDKGKEQKRKPFLGLVHRLDRPVWGVVIFAKTSAAAASLSEQLREGKMEKTYRAMVEGLPDDLEGRLHHYLIRGEGESSRISNRPVPNAQEAVLSYRVIGGHTDRSELEVKLETGRKHQIRAQLAHIGHPILGDRRYGANVLLPGGRLGLMAESLVFAHPVTGARIHVKTPPPPWWPRLGK